MEEDNEVVLRHGLLTTPTGIQTAKHLRDLQQPKPTSNPETDGKWHFAQCFGDKSEQSEVVDGDIISAVEFDGNGEFLASGDRAGRVVLFQRNHSKRKGCEYKFYTEFQSHEAEFDYLKSLEINERINSIAWARESSNSVCLLSANDKTIKLWKVKERRVEAVLENNQTLSNSRLQLPKTVKKESTLAAVPKKIYGHAHAYHIHSLSACSDAETFLSADDLRVNLWHLDDPSGVSFNLVDLKPSAIEDLTEVITTCRFHPSQCNLFAYSTSKGSVRLNDMREAALCDRSTLSFSGINTSQQQPQPFFAEIVQSISDCQFSPREGRYIAARDFMNVRVWDTRKPDMVLSVLPVHDQLKSKLCDLYENDCIFDKFRVCWTPDARQLISGSYGDSVRALDVENGKGTGWAEDIVADRSVFRPAQSSLSPLMGPTRTRRLVGRRTKSLSAASLSDTVDYTRRVLNVAVHPEEMTMAVAATSNLFVFTQPGDKS